MERAVDTAMILHRGSATFTAAFGVLALLLATMGLNGVIAYVAAQHELHDYVAHQGWIFATKKPNVPVLYNSKLVGIKEHRLPDIHIYIGDLRRAD